MAWVNRFAAWLLEENGKRFSYYCAGGLTTSVLLGHVLPHTIFIDKFKEFIHLYKNGFPVKLTDKLKKRFENALDLAKVEAPERELFHPFACYGFDMWSAGTSYSKFGAIIGIPANFFYETRYDIDKDKIRIRDASVVWEADEGKMFENSLVLSEKAQLYAMVWEIKFRQTLKVAMDALSSTIAVGGVYSICNSVNKRFNLYLRPLPVRMILYTLVSAFGYGSWALCKDSSQIYYEMSIDKQIKASSPMLVEGAREYYDKLLLRNVALRKMLGKEGERAWSVKGNVNYFLRQKHLSLMDRRKFFTEEVQIGGEVQTAVLV